jgi:hypothetical protein
VAAFTGVDSDAEYWRRGTRGSGGASALENTAPASVLSVYSLEVRKGFGFGLEAVGSLGVTPDASLVSWGGDLRVAVLEGMAGGRLSMLPDLSLGAALRHVAGLDDLDLTVFAVDARVSRRLVVNNRQILTPSLGFQWVQVSADAQQVDLTPGTAPLLDCGFVGANVPGTTAGTASADSGAPAGVFDGSALCETPGLADFASTVSFGQAVVARQRVLLGLDYRYERLDVGAELITDLLAPGDAQSDSNVKRALECDVNGERCASSPRQWTVAVVVGTEF